MTDIKRRSTEEPYCMWDHKLLGNAFVSSSATLHSCAEFGYVQETRLVRFRCRSKRRTCTTRSRSTRKPCTVCSPPATTTETEPASSKKSSLPRAIILTSREYIHSARSVTVQTAKGVLKPYRITLYLLYEKLYRNC